MINKKVLELLVNQYNKELYSAYLYVEFSNYLEGLSLGGFAHWYTEQAKEEVEHAEKIRKYIFDNGEKLSLEQIDKPVVDFKNVRDVLTAGLKHEEYVTSLINKIYEVALEVKEFKTVEFLGWFVKEQVEEEKNANELITKFDLSGCDKSNHSLYSLDKELANRE